MDETGDVSQCGGGLDERLSRASGGDIDGRGGDLEAGVCQHGGCRLGVAQLEVGEHDVAPRADPPGDR